MNRRTGAAVAAIALVTLLAGISHAQARDIYCAPDNEASNLNGGLNKQITGDFTKMYKDGQSPTGQWMVDWSGPVQVCDATAANGCIFQYSKSTSFSKTKVMGFDAGLTGIGGTAPMPFPVGMFNFSTQKTTTEGWSVLNQTSADPGDRKRPVAKHEWLKTEGHYTGAYTYVGEQDNCHAYVLDPNVTFGHWTALVADETVQTWDKA